MLGRAVLLAAGTLLISGVATAQTTMTPTTTAKAEAPPQSRAETRLPVAQAEPDPLTPSEVQGPPPAAPPAIAPASETATTPTPAAAATPSPVASPDSAAGAAPAVATPDPVVLQIRDALAGQRSRENAADAADRRALSAFYAADGAAVHWTDTQGFTPLAASLMSEIAKADDWGLKASAFTLPSLPAGPLGATARADAEIKLGLAILKYGRHARGGRVDPLSLSKMYDRKPQVYEPGSLIKAATASREPDRYLRGLHPRHAGFRNLQKALVATRAATAGPASSPPTTETEAPTTAKSARGKSKAKQSAPSSRAETIMRIVANMERWRWMPDDLGSFHVWNNVPEQTTTVLKDGKSVFSERIVVGKPDTATPNFSANMQFVIFQPEWGVPPGIKNNEIGPLLRRASADNGGWFGGNGRTPSTVLARHGLRVSVGNRVVDPDSVNWSSVDINRFNFIQPSGPTNVLGVVKFRFPNKHDVYMHDTPQKHLFNASTRAFSHGCMRVRDPVRFAEVLLAHDKGWSPERVRGMVPRGGHITLTTQIPVHNVYFTAIADEDGKLRTLGDLYGADSRVASALEGRSIAVASRGQPPSAEPAAGGRVAQRVKGEHKASRGTTTAAASNPFAGLFGN